MHGLTDQKQPKEQKESKTSWCSSQAIYQKQKVGGFLCATEHITGFYSFGNLPRTYSRESKEFTSPMCSGFQSSHTGKFYMFWASEKQLKVPAAWDIWAIELLIMLFTLRPVWHQAIWLILCKSTNFKTVFRSKMIPGMTGKRDMWRERNLPKKNSDTLHQWCW